MIRITVRFAPDEKDWLDEKARVTGKPMATIVREAVRRYRAADTKQAKFLSADSLKLTHGLWKRGGGLTWPKTPREERRS